MAIIYKKEQYDCIKQNIHVLDLYELSKASGIPQFKLYGILKTLRLPFTEDAAKSFVLRNSEHLDPKQLATIARMLFIEVYDLLHDNGLCLDLVYKPRRRQSNNFNEKKREGIFNVHERENWLI